MELNNRIIGNEGFVFLPKEITYDNSAETTKEIYDMKAMGLNVTVKINGLGGHVLGGYSIIDAIKTTGANTHITGLAASMHGIIAQHGKERIADSHAIGMFHPPSGGKGSEIIELVRDGLKEQLSGRSRLSTEQIDDIMKEGAKDNFMKADKMKSFGLVDRVESSHQNVDIPTNATEEEIFNIYNKLITNENTMTDLEITNELKSLREEKEKVSNQVVDLEAKNLTITDELETVKAENKTLSDQLEVVNKQKAEVLVKNAIESGKLKKEDSEKWVNNAIKDFDMVNDLLGEMKADKLDFVIEDLLNQGGSGSPKKLAEMTEEEVGNFARTNPEAYNKLILEEN